MNPNNSCKNPNELLLALIKDGLNNQEIINYFEALGFEYREIKNQITKVRVHIDLSRVLNE